MHMLKATFSSCAVAAALLGCTSQTPTATATVIEDKVYSVTPPAMTVKAGIVTAALDRYESHRARSERVGHRRDPPAKLTGKLKLQNSSPDQTVRLIGGRIVYIDQRGEPIKLEEARTEPAMKIYIVHVEPARPGPGHHAVHRCRLPCKRSQASGAQGDSD